MSSAARSSPSVIDRAKQNASGIAALLVTGTWLPALMLGYDWWLAALLFGYIVVVPITAILFEEENPVLAENDDRREDALDAVRSRYAAGEIGYEEFEAKLEDLLETETMADTADHVARRRAAAEDADSMVADDEPTVADGSDAPALEADEDERPETR